MSNVVFIRPEARVIKVHWKFLKHVGTCRGIEIHIVATEKTNSPEYVVLLDEIYDGFYEIYNIPQSSVGAWEAVVQFADKVHMALLICESTWVDRGLMADKDVSPAADPEKPG